MGDRSPKTQISDSKATCVKDNASHFYAAAQPHSRRVSASPLEKEEKIACHAVAEQRREVKASQLQVAEGRTLTFSKAEAILQDLAKTDLVRDA